MTTGPNRATESPRRRSAVDQLIETFASGLGNSIGWMAGTASCSWSSP